MLPNFLVAGASKTGSEWLVRCLSEHPDIFISRAGSEFFSSAWARGVAWYESTFDGMSGERAVGEKSTSYFVHPESPSWIADVVPHVHLIFVLREPVSRAVSHYRMKLRAGQVSDAVGDVLVPGHPVVEEGLYHKQLCRFLEHFPREQLTCFFHDDLLERPAEFLADVYRSLGVDAAFEPSLGNRRFHVTKSRPRSQFLFDVGVRASRGVAASGEWGHAIIEWLRRRGLPDVLHRLNRGPRFPELTRDERRTLADYYAPDIEALSRLLGRDLSGWLPE